MSANTYIGKLIDNRYQINGRVGSGGSARVYRAHDTLMGRTVALKILEEDETRYRINSRSFETEVEAISKLSHPNIVTIYDVSMQGNVKYIVMEFVDGITLREYLNFHTHLVHEEIFSCAKQILSALEAAHAKGIVHRDIKPQNVMILKNGRVKVADFGIARLPDADNFKLDDRAIGTVHYISPEQATGNAVDERSDLYSLGILMYEMLTGSRPFEASDASTVAMMQVSDQPAAPRTLRDDVPPALEQVIMRAMRKEPDERYENAAAMLRAIVRAEKHPTSTFKEVFASGNAANKAGLGGFFGKLFGHKAVPQAQEAIVIDGIEDEKLTEQENEEVDENTRTEDEDMKVILDRERYESRRKKWGENGSVEEVAILDSAEGTTIPSADMPIDAPAVTEETDGEMTIEDTVDEVMGFDEEIEEETETIEETAEEIKETAEEVEKTEEEIEETVEEIEEETAGEAEEEIEESVEVTEEETIEEAEEEIEESVEETEKETAEEAEKNADEAEGEDDLDVPDFLNGRIEATVLKDRQNMEALEQEAALNTADTVLFAIPDKKEDFEDSFEDEEEEIATEDDLEDESALELAQKQAELDERFAECDLMNARLDTRAAEADARDAELDKKQAIINAREAEADARFAEAEARFAEAEARVLEADARFAEAVAMREAETQDRAVRFDSSDSSAKSLRLLKILFPLVSGALAVGLCFMIWYSGLLFGRYVPELDRYNGEAQIKGMNVIVDYVRDSSSAGTVLSQTPAAGFTRKDTDTLYLRVSAGKSVYEKYENELDENLKGDADAALAYLEFINTNNANNPQNRAVKVYETSDTVKAGNVIRYEIDPIVDKDGVTTIRLYISIGADE